MTYSLLIMDEVIMKMMQEVERKKIIKGVIEYGGIGLRRQSLRIHKNGAKFPISKNYIDDEVLNPDVNYTIILIPEINISSEISIILSFFTPRKGPQLFFCHPDKFLTKEEQWNIIQNMDKAYDKDYFISESSITPASINYYFEIPSDWARGNKEMLLISIVLNVPITPLIEETLLPACKEFVREIIGEESTFKGLYVDQIEKRPESEHREIKIFNNALKERVRNLYVQIIQVLE